jgi:hypothetical protein
VYWDGRIGGKFLTWSGEKDFRRRMAMQREKKREILRAARAGHQDNKRRRPDEKGTTDSHEGTTQIYVGNIGNPSISLNSKGLITAMITPPTNYTNPWEVHADPRHLPMFTTQNLYPIPDTTAMATAPALIQHIGRYGQMSTLRSDRGTQFVNETIDQLMKLWGIRHEKTIAYSKEENSIVERANKEVMRHLRAIVYDRRSYVRNMVNGILTHGSTHNECARTLHDRCIPSRITVWKSDNELRPSHMA